MKKYNRIYTELEKVAYQCYVKNCDDNNFLKWFNIQMFVNHDSLNKPFIEEAIVKLRKQKIYKILKRHE